ncbi:MAG: RagB/SusD family nutrient uptake outer membrane protein [Paludibacter sp.]|jgi:hypothetical protein|nr:RagB/SusD family nutrient uptake outer membrane protein [Paludibacter sp.]
MKTITYSLMFAFATLIISSCSDDFLKQDNVNELNAGTFWETESDLQKGLIATYGALQLDGLLGGKSVMTLPLRSDIGRPNNWSADGQSFNRLSFNATTELVRLRWQACYIGIYRANQVLENLGRVDLEPDVRNQIEAETRFLRGFFYYVLYQGYNNGSVVVHTTTPKTRADFYKKTSSREEVYKLILSDLEFAEQTLPDNYSASGDIGRVRWGAAAAMLGKLHINERNYADAKVFFERIIESKLYSLCPDIGDNFDEMHEYNQESIFEVAFSIEAKPGTSGGAKDGPTGSEATSRAINFATTQAGGYRVAMPSYYLTMLFRNDTMDVKNPINAARKGLARYSIRTSVSVAISDDDNTTFYQKTSLAGGAYNNGEASYLKKFQNWSWAREKQEAVSGINERVIRYADIMLLYAECLLKTGGSFQTALDLVNEIRKRSGVVLLRQTDYDVNSLMEHIMWVERPLELSFEGYDIRWEDLVRWGKVKEQYDRLATEQYVLVNKVLYHFDPVKHKNFKPIQEFVEAAEVYNPEFHNYFPIPSNELTSNPDILNN